MLLSHQDELSKEERTNIKEYLDIERRKTPESARLNYALHLLLRSL